MGGAYLLWWLRGREYEAAEGIDLGAVQVQHCRELGLAVAQSNDSAEFLKSCPEQFDLVTINYVIEHMDTENGLELLKAAHLSLRRGGMVLVQTPNMCAVSASYARHIEITHVNGYRDSSIREALGVAGFQNVNVWGSKTPVRLKPRRLLWIGLQAASRLLWRAMLVGELGSDALRILTKNLYARGEKL